MDLDDDEWWMKILDVIKGTWECNIFSFNKGNKKNMV